jgi:exopolyphosphatase/pppGpp-phosphohydrolase
VAAARAVVREEFAGLATPLPKVAYAVGGSARALRKLVGKTLGADQLAEAISVLRKTPVDELVAWYGLDHERARTLAAGAVILAEAQLRLAVPLEVVRAGLREGLALTMLAERGVRTTEREAV